MEHGLSIPIILKFSIFIKLILARGFPRTWSMCSLKTREHRFESRVYQICKECIYYHSWYNGEYNRIHEFFFFKRFFSILTRYIFIFVSKNFIFSITKNKISFVATWYNFFYFNASKILRFSFFAILHAHTLWVYKVFIEYGIFRNIEQDITLSTLRCYFSQYIIVRQCFCKRLNVGMYFSMYIRNSMKYYNNKYVRQKMVNRELTFLERSRRRFIVKFFHFRESRWLCISLYLFAFCVSLLLFFFCKSLLRCIVIFSSNKSIDVIINVTKDA